MKKNKILLIAVILNIAIFLGFAINKTEANIIAEQITSNSTLYTYTGNAINNIPEQRLGTGYTQMVGAFQFYYSTDQANVIQPQMQECNTSAYTGCITFVTWNATTSPSTPGNTVALYTFDTFLTSTTSPMKSNKYYKIDLSGNNDINRYGGSSSDVFPGGICVRRNGSTCGSMQDAWFRLADTGGIPSDNTNTRIELIAPTNGATTTTSTTLTVKYYVNSTTNATSTPLSPTDLKIHLFNSLLISGTNVLTIPIDGFAFDTEITYSTTTTLVNNQNYRWYADLVSNTAESSCSNPLIVSALCGFQQANERRIASTPSWVFTVGTNPMNSITDFGNSVFGASGLDSPVLSGQCTIVATSTCDGTSPSTYPGCLLNVMIKAFCPTDNTINYATSTMLSTLSNNMPFSFFYDIVNRVEEITASSTGTQGQDVVVDMGDTFIIGDVTMFSWQSAHDFLHQVVPDTTMQYFIFLEWIFFSILTVYIVIKIL